MFGYGSSAPLPVCGQFHATFETDYKFVTGPITVIDANAENLLLFDTSSELGLLHITAPVHYTARVTSTPM